MKVLLCLSLAALIAATGCTTTSFEVPDGRGGSVKLPAEIYALKLSHDFAAKSIAGVCGDIAKPIELPEGADISDAGVVAIAFAQGQAKEDCADAMADIARTNRPSDYFKYKVAKSNAMWGNILKTGGLLMTGACLLRIGGVCTNNYGGGNGGNNYGDNWTFNQDGSGSTGGGAGTELMPGGNGGTFRPANTVNFGDGNVMGSDLSGSLAGMNEQLQFVNGGTVNEDISTDTRTDSRSTTQNGGGDDLQTAF